MQSNSISYIISLARPVATANFIIELCSKHQSSIYPNVALSCLVMAAYLQLCITYLPQ